MNLKITANHGMRALAICGIEDHVHALISSAVNRSIWHPATKQSVRARLQPGHKSAQKGLSLLPQARGPGKPGFGLLGWRLARSEAERTKKQGLKPIKFEHFRHE